MGKLDSFRIDNNRIDGGGGSGNAQPSDVIAGKTFTNDDGEQVGTHPPDKKFASGTVTSSSTQGNFYIASNSAVTQFRYVTVSGINFLPSRIKVVDSAGSAVSTTLYDVNFDFSLSDGDILVLYGISSSYEINATSGMASITNGSFVLPVPNPSTLYRWEAYE